VRHESLKTAPVTLKVQAQHLPKIEEKDIRKGEHLLIHKTNQLDGASQQSQTPSGFAWNDTPSEVWQRKKYKRRLQEEGSLANDQRGLMRG
jgi:hypothetical protein